MKTLLSRLRFIAPLLLLAQTGPNLVAADRTVLWQIGVKDHDDAEFALAPDGWAKFKEDGFFVVGESAAKRDWPYVHPGPADAWAGSRRHTFTVFFALRATPVAGQCRLEVNLVDTHSAGPPKLNVRVNSRDFEQSLPNGAGDDSIHGQPAKGRAHKFTVEFPCDLLRAGDNNIQITTATGSWMLYDSLSLETPDGLELGKVSSRTVIGRIEPVPALREENGRAVQPVLITVRHFGEPLDASLKIDGGVGKAVKLQQGDQTVELGVTGVERQLQRTFTVEVDGRTLATSSASLSPVHKLTIYILPHSHTDIGYTEIQTAIEKKQVNNLLEGIAAARRTADYPNGARFVWNVEVLWAADLYLHRLDESQRADFFAAVKKGQVVLNGMYLNELTGLCRPEELLHLFRFATEVSQQTGVPIDSAMISDVPGYTWGAVTAMRQAGIKYFSTAPNYFDRIGTIMREWENKPFYWLGPDGQSKILVWIPFWGYAMSHVYSQMSPKLVAELCNGLEKRGYPYEIAYVRWSGHGDNAVPDPAICDFVRDWNAKYTWPKFIISGTSEAFRAFEQRYGSKLPVVRGDWTPYWEDGAGSSALETGMNRQSSDRLVQAEALFAMRASQSYPAADFDRAWKDVLLYSEHTWGAWCSISEPERRETLEQWAIKKSYADQAARESSELLTQALEASLRGATTKVATSAASGQPVDVINTLSWPRTGLVTLSAELSAAGDRVSDEHGATVPSQRLRSGELVFLAERMPPLATKRYFVSAGPAAVTAPAKALGATLDNGIVRARLDARTGGIIELAARGIDSNLVDSSKGEDVNDYLYLVGDDLKDLKRNGAVQIKVAENGPLVASLLVESEAPGCNKLVRELRVVAGQDYLELFDLVDKARLQAKSYRENEGKESLNFAFPFNVPDGDLLLDVPLGLVRPETDQMPSACKNWLSVGRWVDVSSKRFGVTWVTLDAPLIEIGSLTARLLNSQTNPDVWRKKIERTQRFYSWAMNNHWGTNYRAYQEGPTMFRFILRPHRQPDPAEASRFAIGFSQPLLVRRAGERVAAKPLLEVSPDDVLVSALKPSDDGKAWIVRLFGASGKTRATTLHWGERSPKMVFLSDTSEKPGEKAGNRVTVPGCGLVTLRAEFE